MHDKKYFKTRLWLAFIGNIIIGLCVGLYRLSELGVDSCSGMNLGISDFLNMSFGNWQLICNILILVAVFFTVRSYIGIGTVINMVGVGYIADFICWLGWDVAGLELNLVIRLVLMSVALVCAPLGVALYMKADMGLSPYDSIAPIVEHLTKGKVSFRKARVTTDVLGLVIGVVFCLLAGGNVWRIAGIGTILNAVITGPIIQFFRTKIDKKLGDI